MEIKEINKASAQLKSEIEKLKKRDPFTIEKLAREEFNMSRPDEYLFIYDDKGDFPKGPAVQ